VLRRLNALWLRARDQDQRKLVTGRYGSSWFAFGELGRANVSDNVDLRCPAITCERSLLVYAFGACGGSILARFDR
jgi:hypothetical protein